MSDQLLFALKLCLLALLYLFFFRVLRAVWAELRPPTTTPAPAAAPGAGQAQQRQIPPPVPAPPAPLLRHLVVVEPADQAGRSFPMEGEVTVGRAPGCGVQVVDDSFVSQVHARVFGAEGAWQVEDMGSTNGTFVNEQRVGGPAAIRVGDRLRVGSTVLEMR